MTLSARILPLPLLLATVAFSAISGCSGAPKLVSVTGKVVHKGQPLTAGTIYFHPAPGNASKEEKSTCLLQLDGSFVMRTYPYGNGVPPGSYRVTFTPELANRIKLPQYADPEKTPLHLEVPDSGVQDHVFDVK
jgi:hypothetical protein